MDPERFDTLTRMLATPLSRRGGLRLLASTLAGVLLPWRVQTVQAEACTVGLPPGVTGYICVHTCCPPDDLCCQFTITTGVNAGTVVGNCCHPGTICDPDNPALCKLGCSSDFPKACGQNCCGQHELCVDSILGQCCPSCGPDNPAEIIFPIPNISPTSIAGTCAFAGPDNPLQPPMPVFTACCKEDNLWHLQVVSVTSRTRIQYDLQGRTDITDEFSSAITAANYCDIVKDLSKHAKQYSECDNSPYANSTCIITHETTHLLEWQDLFTQHWEAEAEPQLEALTLPAFLAMTAPQAVQQLQSQINAILENFWTNLRKEWTNDATLHDTRKDRQNDEAFQAGAACNQRIATKICQKAQAQGWPKCSACK